MPRGRSSSGASLFRSWEAAHAPRPEVLYHYSSALGLLSMMKSGHVWATESRYMNDPREFVHGAELILSIVNERLKEKNAPGALFELRDAVSVHVEEKRQNLRVFCLSFCAHGDLLSQWRGYGDAGGGYALGFRPELLLGRKKAERPPLRVLRKIIYDPDEQRAQVNAWLDHTAASGMATQEFWSFFSEAIVSFKDAAYQEEGEWRLIQFGRAWEGSKVWLHPVNFRERKGRIIPYADIDLSASPGEYAGRLPIAVIVQGPTQDPERSSKALRLLVEACGYTEKQVELKHSSVPFTG